MRRKKYRKHKDQYVIAVQIKLETEGMTYLKWGAEQRCRAGDWLVNNQGSCYTIDEQSFSQTYQELAPGQYIKTVPVWAAQADDEGRVDTQEGSTGYGPGDYIVSNNPDGTDSYAVSRVKFESMYDLAAD